MDRTGLEFGFLVMGSGFAHPPFLSVLRQCISRGRPPLHTLSSSTLASASEAAPPAMAFINMAAADPPYRPAPCEPAYAYGSTSNPLCNPPPQQRAHSAHSSARFGPFSSHIQHPQQTVRALGDSQGGHRPGPSLSYPQAQEHEWVAGPNGVRYLVSQGSASDRRRLIPSDPASEGDVVKRLIVYALQGLETMTVCGTHLIWDDGVPLGSEASSILNGAHGPLPCTDSLLRSLVDQ